jgi:hypothetical protein
VEGTWIIKQVVNLPSNTNLCWKMPHSICLSLSAILGDFYCLYLDIGKGTKFRFKLRSPYLTHCCGLNCVLPKDKLNVTSFGSKFVQT